uniref:Response regulator receiver modulated diguanylate cyclase/phosphodiesterase with PAS/PAC sensor(S) n=1 Tax=Leptospirillum sp. Group II '5-way CG' TaxID=419541 RepID=B6APP0_9BACT|nr:MAG: Response regulator receiver modulated diguanylate cyclase/phosphodiesterase with PAS/PAC sensor(s) [Leptospirillum sp. Group II '5-way CG']
MIPENFPDRKVRVLFLEDVPEDVEMEVRELSRAGLSVEIRVAADETGFVHALRSFLPDVILSDYTLPTNFNGLRALAIARQEFPDTPFIFVSGTIGEERAIEAMRDGAADYILKEHQDRLGLAVIHAISNSRKKILLKKAEEALRESESRFSSFMQNFPGVAFIRDHDACYQYVNDYWLRMFSKGPDDVLNKRLSDIWDPDIAEGLRNNDRAVLSTGKPIQTVEVTRMGGRMKYWLANKFLIPSLTEGGEARVGGVSIDITSHHEQELRIIRINRSLRLLSGINAVIVRVREQEDLFREFCRLSIEDGNFPAVWIAGFNRDTGERRILASRARSGGVQVQRNWPERFLMDENGVGKTLREKEDVVFSVPTVSGHEPLPSDSYDHMVAAFSVRLGKEEDGALVFHADDRQIFDQEEKLLLRELADNLSFALEAVEKQKQLDYLAYHDNATGLANRSLFLDRLRQSMDLPKALSPLTAIVVLSIERMQFVYDTLGRIAGEELIALYSARLSSLVLNVNRIGRIGDNLFAISLNIFPSVEEIVHFVQDRLLPHLSDPFIIGGQEVRILTRLGISLSPEDSRDAETLLSAATTALSNAQRDGETYRFYTRGMNELVRERLSLESHLLRALKNREFVLYYQPKVRLSNGSIEGVEALIRWQDPDKGMVLPSRFIPTLEETGLILPVGEWVVQQALSDLSGWIAKGLSVPRVSVNVSSLQLRHRDFLESLVRLWGPEERAGLLEIEITESLILDDVPGTIATLEEIRSRGMTVSIDDFGTGYSSLSYLASLPVNTLKIDQSFVAQLGDRPESLSIVSAIISLAHSLNLSVVAEGVEKESQLSMLKNLGCDAIQGFLISEALPADLFEAFLQNEKGFLPGS